jgi:general secretion pathway protein G
MKELQKPGIRSDSGFTLIELVIIIIVLAVLASVGVPVLGKMIMTARKESTRKELYTLKMAIVGRMGSNPIRGYETDVGQPPPTLQGLVTKPAGVADYDRFTMTGWNGPYVEEDGGSYLEDPWGANYVYDSTLRTIMSIGGPDTITVAF